MIRLRHTFLVLSVLFASFAFAQSADQQIVSAIDAPDPVVPGQTLTYTVTFQNNGPDAATNGGVNILLDGNFTPTSVTPPAGFNCTALAQVMTCSTPSFGPGAPQVLTITGTVAAHLNSFPDGTLTSSFTTSGTTPDPNSGNNSSGNVVTAYNSPQVDLSIAVTDNPDPVFPDGTVTYTVQATNSGPDAASSVTFNAVPASPLKFQSATIPAGWSCSLPAVDAINATFSCTRPTWAPGTDVFTVVFLADDQQFGINDGSFQSVFNVFAGASDETDDGSDNQETETTQYVAPDANVTLTVTDSPDPVFPDGNITYTVTVGNAGPDTAPNITLSSFGSNNLRFVSATVPAGWNCTLPASGAQTPGYSCTLAAGLASGASSVLTFVMQADDDILGINDQTILFGFQANSTIADPVPGNNSETESTAYTTPDADVTVTVSDSPDPVSPDGNITYTVTVANAGPDTAPNITLNSFGSNNLRFVSASVPAGWNCTLPASGAQTAGYSCTLAAGLANGASSVLTFVMQADDALLGINDTTILFGFSANSTISDPVPGNNSETESTAYTTADANVSITASDSPDPVTNGGNVTFTVDAANGGPDTATNATVTLAPHPSLTFQSVTAPAGWTCTDPGVNNAGVTQCTNPSWVSGGTAQFTLVTKLVAAGSGGTLNSNFTVSSSVQDPVPANNSVEVFTNWIGQASDLSIGKTTLQTAAAQGSTITYTVTTQNNGPGDVTNVSVTDVLPAQLLFQSITAPAGWSCTTPAVGANGTITCTIANFVNGASANFTLVTTVAPNATGTIANSATVGGASNSDPNGANNAGATSPVAVAGNADLSIVKSGEPATAPRGSTINYVLSITNAGPDPAASVVLTDVLPSSLHYQSINAPGWSCTTPSIGATGTITCTIASLPLGPSSITIAVTVAPDATGSIVNSASITHSGTDSNPGNSTGTSGPTAVDPAADLSIVKSTAESTATQGEIFAYTIALTNSGPDTAANVAMNDALPANLLFQSIAVPAGFTCTTPAVGATGMISCTGGTIANGATATFTLTVQVANDASGTITNTATASSDTPDPDSGDLSSTTSPIPTDAAPGDLQMTKTTTATNVPTGSTFNYTLTVRNNGPGTQPNVVVSDTLPAGLQFVSATPSQGTCTTGSPFTCNLGALAGGSQATITLTVLVTATGGSIVNTATVSPVDSNPGNNSDDAPAVFPTGGPAGEAQIPTLSEWMLLALMGMLGVVAIFRMRT